MLFSESPSRIILSFPAAAHAGLAEMAERAECSFALIGRVGGDRLRIRLAGSESVSLVVGELENVWRTSLATRLEAEVMAAGRE